MPVATLAELAIPRPASKRGDCESVIDYITSSASVDDVWVTGSNENAQEEEPEGVMRLVMLWVCWVVLAVFLATAGIVACS